MISYRDLFLSAPFVGVGLGVLLLIFVVATGQTFGQRCARAFPDRPDLKEVCVYRLKNGLEPPIAPGDPA